MEVVYTKYIPPRREYILYIPPRREYILYLLPPFLVTGFQAFCWSIPGNTALACS